MTERKAIEEIAAVLGLTLPDPDQCDPVRAIVLDIRRLLDVQKRWMKACDVVREHCPVDVGRSYFDPGIPLLAKRAKKAEEQRNRARAVVLHIRHLKSAAVSDIFSVEDLDIALADEPPKEKK
jgi:hypothetical protein